ncbi:monocarboxylate transporter 9-like [Pollicipes pollicipes]|uniref:monocarboxylate transporter 9-like n=1 Tax=Pollicipes pollicipes TaxID=41117 RepID=UPI001885318F|nr:monocarboxylate transporter 9-like [Pollicipes pollicipes]
MTPDVSYFRRLGHDLRSLPAGGVLAVTVGFLLQISLGGLFTFGNLTTYLTSYLRGRGGQDVGYGQTVWVGTLMGMTEGLALLPGSVLYQRYGPRSVVLLGSVMASGAIALTSLTVDSSLLWVTMTYSVLNGLGVGLVYSVPMLVGHRWFPDRKGLVNGLVFGGYSLGGILFTTVQTSFLNPDNVSPEEDGFFHDAALLDRVPLVFLLQAGVCAALQLTAVLGLRNPPARNVQAEES